MGYETKTTQLRTEALDRARSGQSMGNYPAIFSGFAQKGIPEADILPRENIFTFQAWKAQGRVVRRGEHGVKVMTWVEMTGKEDEAKTTFRRPKATTVFHVSQTDPL